MRAGAALAGRGLAVLLILLAASGRLPHLVLTQAILSSLLTMVAAPMSLLPLQPARPRRWSIPAFPAIALMSVGTIGYQAPPVVAVIGEGGPLTALALLALFAMAMGFWSVVVPPARLHGLHAAGYVVAGSLPISMPAMFLIMLPRDIYATFHAAATTAALAPMDDQTFSGFVMFAVVKITLFVAFSVIFMAAANERVEGDRGDDGGDGSRRQPPALPGWVQAILRGGPTTDEPAPAPRREAVGGTRR